MNCQNEMYISSKNEGFFNPEASSDLLRHSCHTFVNWSQRETLNITDPGRHWDLHRWMIDAFRKTALAVNQKFVRENQIESSTFHNIFYIFNWSITPCLLCNATSVNQNYTQSQTEQIPMIDVRNIVTSKDASVLFQTNEHCSKTWTESKRKNEQDSRVPTEFSGAILYFLYEGFTKDENVLVSQKKKNNFSSSL